MRLTGVALVVFLGSIVLPGQPGALIESFTDPLLEYSEYTQTVKVRARDGCLIYHKDTASRGADLVLSYCPARIPEGAKGWAPQFRDFYTVDATQRTVTELVQFGMVPDAVVRVRFTLPGGHPVETATRRVTDLQHPVVLLHLRQVALPVDLTETDGRRVFVRLEMFDAAGREVPVV
jgi:hypothetical protein